MRRILLLDGDRLLATLLGSLLEQHDFELLHAPTLADAQRMLDDGVELLLMEPTLPDGDGLAYLRGLRDRGDRRPIVLLSDKPDDQDCIRGLNAGADDYVLKPFNYLVLIARLEVALRRIGWSMPTSQTRDMLDADQRTLRVGGRLVPLTFTEFKLLEVLTGRPGRAFSRDELWQALDEGGSGGGYDRAIDLHVGRLRGKLELDAKEPRHLLTVRGVGYRWSW